MGRSIRSGRLGTLAVIGTLAWPLVTTAEMATDGTVGRKVRLGGKNVEVAADLGQVRGKNLFHSFQLGLETAFAERRRGPAVDGRATDREAPRDFILGQAPSAAATTRRRRSPE